MIIEYSGQTSEQKIKTLRDSVQRALYAYEMEIDEVIENIGKTDNKIDQVQKALDTKVEQEFNVADNEGYAIIGDLLIEWGIAPITTGSTVSEGLYSGEAEVTFANPYGFEYIPAVMLTWSENWSNQHSVNTRQTGTESFLAYGRTTTPNSERNIRWLAVGKKKP